MTLLGALLLPLRAASVRLKGSKITPLASHIVRESIKWTNRDADGVAALHAEAPRVLHVSQRMQVRPRPLRCMLGGVTVF